MLHCGSPLFLGSVKNRSEREQAELRRVRLRKPSFCLVRLSEPGLGTAGNTAKIRFDTPLPCPLCRWPMTWGFPTGALSSIRAVMTYVISAGLFGLLAYLAWTDLKTKELPNLPVLAVAGLGAFHVYKTAPDLLLQKSLTAGATVLGFLVLVELYQRVRGQFGMGMGDAKLFAALSFWLPLTQVFFLIAGACLLFALVSVYLRRGREGGAHDEQPFGPYIVAAFAALFLALPQATSIPNHLVL